ncbi:glycosyltransferase [Rugosimonospora africana]|nr:nucleotide disphospho-sugar-binding domain-containing protein [Rugosimonospora africana]
MKIAFRGHPYFGHLYPLMPLAYAARDAGHEVIFPTTGPFSNRIAALGFCTVEAGILLDEARRRRFGRPLAPTADDDNMVWNVVGEYFAEAAVAVATDLRQLQPELAIDLVVHEDTDLGAAAAAAAAGIASVSVAITRSLDPHVVEAFRGPVLRELQVRFGTVPRPDDLVLDSYPPSLQRPAFRTDPRRVPLRPVPWAEPSLPLPPWVGTRDRKLIFVTLGTVAGTIETMQLIIDGLAPLDADILVATGANDPAFLAALPDNVHVETFVHQANLVPHIDLMVHHGGGGTTSSAWVHGVPQLVLPDGADRFLNAEAVAASGGGIELRTPTPELIATSARLLLDDPAYRRSAGAVRDELAALPEPAAVLSTL